MADRPTQILDAAARLFRARGFHGVSVDEIGKEVGITGGALYHHFAGKDDILATLLTQAIDRVVVATDETFDDPADELEFVVRHHASFVVDHRELVAIYAHEHRALVEPYKRRFARRIREHAARWEQVVARAYPEASAADVALTVQAAIGMLHSVVLWPPKLLDRKDIVDTLSAHALASMDTLAPAAARG